MRVLALLWLAAAAFAGCADLQGEEQRGSRTDCIACHQPEYEGARNHVDKKPTTCGVCHSETSWHRAEREHLWPLTGAHEKANCFSCHEGKPEHYKDTSEECFACHRDDFEPPPFAEHAHYAHQCDDCHSTAHWKPTLEGKGKRSKAQGTPTVTATATTTAPPKPTSTVSVPNPRPTTPKPKPKPKPTTPPPDATSGASEHR